MFLKPKKQNSDPTRISNRMLQLREMGVSVFLVSALVFSGLLSLSKEALGVPVDKLALLELLRAGEYKALDARLSELQESSEAADGQDEWVGVAFNSFAIRDPGHMERLDEWVAEMPNSCAARVSRGFLYWDLGWSARGGAFASKTSDEQFAGMRRYHAAARDDFNAALEINERLGVAYSILISIATAEGNDEERYRLLTKGLEVAPRSYNIRWMFLHSLNPKWGGSLDSIEAFVQSIVEPYSDDAALQTLRGYVDLIRAEQSASKGNYQEALTYYDRALVHGPHWSYLSGRAGILRRLQRYDEALESYNQSIALRPHSGNVLAPRGRLHYQAGRYVDALEDLTLAVNLSPLNPYHLKDRAQVLWDLQRLDLALQDLDRALIYGSDYSSVRGTRGRLLLFGMQDATGALPDLQRAVELVPDGVNNRFNYIIALYQLRDCRIVDSIHRFQELCRAREISCPKERLDWVEQVLQFLDSQGTCPN